MKYRYFRASLIVIVIAFTCAVGNSPEGTASGPDNGKYCIDNGATMLLVRLGSNGSLEFGMSSWAFRGHYFGVTGLAQPDPSGWRFRENMNAADPRERCETLIARLSDGGYSFSLTQAGRCEANGGVGAPRHRTPRSFFLRGRGKVRCRKTSRWRRRCPRSRAGSAATSRTEDAELSAQCVADCETGGWCCGADPGGRARICVAAFAG
jgi:hypothetical protein